MQIPRPSDETKTFFQAVVPDAPGVVVKPMFGNLGAFVNGNMFAGLFGDTIGVKLLDDASRDELLGIDGTGPYGPAERPMGGYVSLPAAWSADPARVTPWIERALAQVSELPAKAPKAPKPPKPPKSR
ncbi:TfoX/Sxy family protein [Leifsonia sp. NPDC058248]|uniref:TfoX/Sxy family protein n=1 Tax=Leifsonia sp. NPDC058248 TaxID=3346402 RepID=UPI0036DE28B3